MKPRLAQGLFYVISGVWPIVHMKSFEAVTGKKSDGWLVQTTGALIAAIGVALLVGRDDRQSRTLGIASALVLGGADLVFVGKRRISKVYLADAAAEAALIGAWIRR